MAEEGEFNEFDLNEFFFAEGEGEDAKFEHENEVQKWLDLIRGAFRGTMVDDLKLGKDSPPLPFQTPGCWACCTLVLVPAECGIVLCDGKPARRNRKRSITITTWWLRQDRGRDRRRGVTAGA